MFQKQFVEHGLKEEIQNDKRLASVINNQQFLNDFPQRLPHGAALPDILAIPNELSMNDLYLAHALGDPRKLIGFSTPAPVTVDEVMT